MGDGTGWGSPLVLHRLPHSHPAADVTMICGLLENACKLGRHTPAHLRQLSRVGPPYTPAGRPPARAPPGCGPPSGQGCSPRCSAAAPRVHAPGPAWPCSPRANGGLQSALDPPRRTSIPGILTRLMSPMHQLTSMPVQLKRRRPARSSVSQGALPSHSVCAGGRSHAGRHVHRGRERGATPSLDVIQVVHLELLLLLVQLQLPGSALRGREHGVQRVRLDAAWLATSMGSGKQCQRRADPLARSKNALVRAATQRPAARCQLSSPLAPRSASPPAHSGAA